TIATRPTKASRRTFRSPLPIRSNRRCFAFAGLPSRTAVAVTAAVLAAFVGTLAAPVGGWLGGWTVIAATPSPGGSETPASQPPAPAGQTCSGSLQALVERAAP